LGEPLRRRTRVLRDERGGIAAGDGGVKGSQNEVAEIGENVDGGAANPVVAHVPFVQPRNDADQLEKEPERGRNVDLEQPTVERNVLVGACYEAGGVVPREANNLDNSGKTINLCAFCITPIAVQCIVFHLFS
jgi:hypothetical protein